MKKIVVSLAVSVLVLIAFISATVASRRGLPIGLVDIYGDTYGIRRLTIQGEVISRDSYYGYTFHISPDGDVSRIHVFNNSRDFTNFFRMPWPFSPVWGMFSFETAYVPVKPYELVATESVIFFTTGLGGNHIVQTEYRVYGEYFAVESRLHSRRLYVPQSGTEHKLFVDAGPDGYIFSLLQCYSLGFTPGFHRQRAWGLRLHDQLAIGDTLLFVPNDPGLFGQTTVYAVHAPGGIIPMTQDYFCAESVPMFFVVAEALFPITLERGEDEIIGLIELPEDSFLLLVKRTGGFELTRISLLTGEIQTVFVESSAVFHNVYLKEGSFVLHGSEAGGFYGIVAAFDLRENGLILSGIFPVRLWEQPGYGPDAFVQIHDILLKEDVVYIAYSIDKHPWSFSTPNVEAFISALDTQGQLIGRSQVLNGVEDDAYWIWGTTGAMQRYHRRLQAVSIR